MSDDTSFSRKTGSSRRNARQHCELETLRAERVASVTQDIVDATARNDVEGARDWRDLTLSRDFAERRK